VNYKGSLNNKDFTFKGICSPYLPLRCMSKNGRLILLSGLCGTVFVPMLVNAKTGQILVLCAMKNIRILDVFEDPEKNLLLAAAHVSRGDPDEIVIGTYHTNSGVVNHQTGFGRFSGSEGLPPVEMIAETHFLKPEEGHPDEKYEDVNFNYVYVGVNPIGKIPPRSRSTPVILWPHGGPHSILTDEHDLLPFFFNLMGYAIIMVNYRGSLGNGKKGVDSLLGHIGDIDVKDCMQALKHALRFYKHLDPDQVVLNGGSHGGFLVLHLAARFGNYFRGVVARNPVTDLTSKVGTGDIPDWAFNEVGLNYKWKPPSNCT